MNSKTIPILLMIVISIIYEVTCVDPVPVWKGKRYELEKSEKFDDLLTELGVNFFKRKFILLQEPVMELIDAGNDEYIIRQSTTLKTIEVKFKPGVEFESDNPLEGKTKAKIIFENPNKLIQTNMEGPDIQVVREFTETELIMTFTHNNIEAKRWFKAI